MAAALLAAIIITRSHKNNLHDRSPFHRLLSRIEAAQQELTVLLLSERAGEKTFH